MILRNFSKENHQELIDNNIFYKSIWNQLEYIEDYLSPFISLDQLYPKFGTLVDLGIENKETLDKHFFLNIIDWMSNLTEYIASQCEIFHNSNLTLGEVASQELISKLSIAINKYAVNLVEVKGYPNFYGRILPIVN